MRIFNLSLINFRNYEKLSIKFNDNINTYYLFDQSLYLNIFFLYLDYLLLYQDHLDKTKLLSN